MTIDITKIKAGDRVVFEAEVSSVNIDSDWPIRIKDNTDIITTVSASLLIEHKPKKVKFRTGDIVYRKSFGKKRKYKIIALQNDISWCKELDTNSFSTIPISFLEHVNEN